MKWFNPNLWYRDLRGILRDYKMGAVLVDTLSSIRTWVAAFFLSASVPSWAQDLSKRVITPVKERTDEYWPIVWDWLTGTFDLVGAFLTTS